MTERPEQASERARPTGLSRLPDALAALRASVAIAAGKTARLASRRLGRGGGTALPGVVASAIAPDLLSRLGRQLEAGSVVVAGTNGKTTTARMLADILGRGGYPVLHNRSGANLLSGMTATLVEAASLTGNLRGRIGVFEADELALPGALARLQPRLIVLTNLFRDQLDRYGELETIAGAWQRALAALPASTTLVLNADDPTLPLLAEGSPAHQITFGVADRRHRLAALPHAADAAICRRCGTALTYDAHYLSHLGDYHCPGCAYRRPALDLTAEQIELDGLRGLRLQATGAGLRLDLTVAVPGFYNAYNVLAASLAARQLGIPEPVIAAALADFRAPFGRVERVRYRQRDLLLMLAKNPVGFNEVLRLLSSLPPSERGPVLIVINDLTADGRDISWLWDVDFEGLADWPQPLLTGGLRAHDMALRLKYAGCQAAGIRPLTEIAEALDAVVEMTPPGQTAALLLTYTALLQTRQVLADRGAVEQFWQQ